VVLNAIFKIITVFLGILYANQKADNLMVCTTVELNHFQMGGGGRRAGGPGRGGGGGGGGVGGEEEEG